MGHRVYTQQGGRGPVGRICPPTLKSRGHTTTKGLRIGPPPQF